VFDSPGRRWRKPKGVKVEESKKELLKAIGRRNHTRNELADLLGWDPNFTARVLAACVADGTLRKPGAQRGRTTVYERP
jgi:predicted HTH transcriptional regulator